MENLPERLAASGAVKMRVKLGSISGGKVLDVATGPGDYIDTLMKALKDYDCFVGIDISQKDLKSAKKRFRDKPVKLMDMNAESLEFDDSSFDTVCMAYSLHHLERIDKVLAEMHRVLKPGGNFIVQEEFSDGKQTEAQKTNILQHAWEAQIDSLLGETHKPTFTKHRIQEVVGNLPLEGTELFESAHPVECLFCEKKFRCDNPKSEEEIDGSLKEIEDNLKRLKEIAAPRARIKLQKIANKLKERNRKFGNAHPSVLLAIGRKASAPKTSGGNQLTNRVERVLTWTRFKELLVKLRPDEIFFAQGLAPLARPPVELRLIFTAKRVQYIFIDTPEESVLRRTKIVVRTDKYKNPTIREKDIEKFIRTELRRDEIKIRSFELMGGY